MPNSVLEIGLDELGLSWRCYRRLTQSGRITTLDQLLRCEPDHFIWCYWFSKGSVEEVKSALAKRGLRLASRKDTPCLPAPEGDEWVRLNRKASCPSWYPRSTLLGVELSLVIGAASSSLAGNGIVTIADACAKTRAQLLLLVEIGRAHV